MEKGPLRLAIVTLALCVSESLSDVTPPDGVKNLYSNQGCEQVRTCFKSAGCEGDDLCTVFSSWWPSENGEDTDFALYGNVGESGYVAVGISQTPGMLDTDVYACTTSGDLIRYFNNPDKSKSTATEYRPLIGVANEDISMEDGFVRCSFSRRHRPQPDGDASFFDLSGDNVYYSLLAAGGLNADGNISFHSVAWLGSSEAISFNTVNGVRVDKTALRMKKAHGIMMLVAWISIAGFGITFARYFREQWPDEMPCGVKLWFAIHRTYMLIAATVIVAAFVIIFVEKGSYVKPDEGIKRFLHAIFGTFNLFFVVLNIIGALFRPKPGAPKRQYFNYAHRTGGLAAYMTAIACIFLAVNMESPFVALPDDSSFWVMVGFISVHTLSWLYLEYHDRFASKSEEREVLLKPENRTNDVPMGGSDPTETKIIQKGPVTKTILLYAYAAVLIFTIAWISTKIGVATS